MLFVVMKIQIAEQTQDSTGSALHPAPCSEALCWDKNRAQPSDCSVPRMHVIAQIAQNSEAVCNRHIQNQQH